MEMTNTKKVSFQYYSTLDMGANALTKPVPTPKHFKCMQLLGLRTQKYLDEVGVL
jgi:hypothetical protein